MSSLALWRRHAYMDTMAKLIRNVPTLLLVLALGACAGRPFSADVTTFHRFGGNATNGSFVLIPLQEQNRESLEFASYASLVANALTARGLRQVDRLEDADYVARLDYAIGAGTVQSRSVPVYGAYPDQYSVVRGRTADGEPFSARVFESGGYVPLGYAQEAQTVYRRSLSLDILDGPAWRTGSIRKVYEGRSISVGPEAELARVMRPLIDALFVDFPGPTGMTRTVVLPD